MLKGEFKNDASADECEFKGKGLDDAKVGECDFEGDGTDSTVWASTDTFLVSRMVSSASTAQV